MKRWEWFECALRIGESVTAGMCECHIPNAKGIVLSKDGEWIAYLVTADRGKDMGSQIFGLRRAEVGMYLSTPSYTAIFPDRIVSLASSALKLVEIFV